MRDSELRSRAADRSAALRRRRGRAPARGLRLRPEHPARPARGPGRRSREHLRHELRRRHPDAHPGDAPERCRRLRLPDGGVGRRLAARRALAGVRQEPATVADGVRRGACSGSARSCSRYSHVFAFSMLADGRRRLRGDRDGRHREHDAPARVARRAARPGDELLHDDLRGLDPDRRPADGRHRLGPRHRDRDGRSAGSCRWRSASARSPGSVGAASIGPSGRGCRAKATGAAAMAGSLPEGARPR